MLKAEICFLIELERQQGGLMSGSITAKYRCCGLDWCYEMELSFLDKYQKSLLSGLLMRWQGLRFFALVIVLLLELLNNIFR